MILFPLKRRDEGGEEEREDVNREATEFDRLSDCKLDATRPRLILRCESQTNRGEDAVIVWVVRDERALWTAQRLVRARGVDLPFLSSLSA